MTIEFKKGRYLSAIWYVELPKVGGARPGNLLATLYKDEGEHWTYVFRLRWYNDTDLTDESEDDKEWHEFRCDDVETEEMAFGVINNRVNTFVDAAREFSGKNIEVELTRISMDSGDWMAKASAEGTLPSFFQMSSVKREGPLH